MEQQQNAKLAWLLKRARRYADHGNAEAVEGVMLQFLQESPDDVGALGMLGAARFESGRMQAAARAYERALAVDPGLRLLRYQLGLVQAAMGQNETALATWQPLLEGDDDEFMAHFQSAQACLALDRRGDARALQRTARERMPQDHPLSELLDKMLGPQAGPPAT